MGRSNGVEAAVISNRGEIRFGTTHWTVVLRAGHESSSESREALEELCGSYWYPLYAYVRRNGYDAHQAQDMTQAFFARFLERQYLKLADRQRGRFRTFLLTSLKHFLISEWRETQRKKNGGGQTVVSLDEAAAESRLAAEPAVEQPPDALYDRGWAAIVMDRALTALRAEFAQSGKQDLFDRLKIYVWGEKNGQPYAETGEQLGMSESAVKVAVHRMRQRYGELLRTEVAHTVSTPVEVEEELRYLAAVIRTGAVGLCNVAKEKS